MPGCPDRLEGGPELRTGRDEVDGVERRPERPAGEDGDAVDVDVQAVALDVVIRPRAGARSSGSRPVRGRPSRLRPRRPRQPARPSSAPALRGCAATSASRRGCEPHRRTERLRRRRRRPATGDRRPAVPGGSVHRHDHGARQRRSIRPMEPQADREDAVVALDRGSGAPPRRRRARGAAPARPAATGRPAPAPRRTPGSRPRSVVRIQRRLLSATSRVRQRARGFRGISRSGRERREADRRARSRPRSSRPTSTRCSSNIERLARTCAPLSQASAIVARPPSRRTTSSSASAAGGVEGECDTTSPRRPGRRTAARRRGGPRPPSREHGRAARQARRSPPGRRSRPASWRPPASRDRGARARIRRPARPGAVAVMRVSRLRASSASIASARRRSARSSRRSGSNGRRRASLKPRTLQPSTIRPIAAEAGAPASPSSQSTWDASSSNPAPAIRNVAKVNAW